MRINAKLPPHETCGKDLFAFFDSIDVIWLGAKVPGSHQLGAFLAGYFGPNELRSAPSSCQSSGHGKDEIFIGFFQVVILQWRARIQAIGKESLSETTGCQ